MYHLRKISFFVLLFLCFIIPQSVYSAKDKGAITRIRSWRLPNDLAVADTLAVDTAWLNYPMHDAVNDYSISNAYNGNIVSPLLSNIYFSRQHKTDFIFADAYAPYLLTPYDVHFFNTTTPFSTIAYKRGFTTYHEEHDLDFSFTGNLNRRTNLGVTVNYLTGAGHYLNQAGKRFNMSAFGSYHGDHYGCQGAFTVNQLSNFENGGIKTDEDIDLGVLKSYDIPVYTNGMSGFRYISGFWNQHYSICTERERRVNEDSITIDYIPVTTFMHTLDIHQSVKRYIERSEQDYYANSYFNKTQTNDSVNALTISNTLSVTFEEDFNKWLHIGAKVYARNECVRYAYQTSDNRPAIGMGFANDFSYLTENIYLPSDSTIGHHWTSNTFIGGSLYKNHSKWVSFNATGDVCLTGYKIGEFNIQGNINSRIPTGKDTIILKANAYIRNETPDYFLQHYRSNHYCWDNDFRKIYRFFIGGEIMYPTKWFDIKANVRFENITKYIYFNYDGLPKQYNHNIQVTAVDGQINIHTKRFGMENNMVWQMSSNEILPLPSIVIYNNIYYKDCWFKALNVQIGIDMRFFTKYYATVLDPATGQFRIQDKNDTSHQKVGNYPVLNAYANFYVKPIRLRFFAHVTHFNQSFMKSKNYYTMPAYPLNPTVFRAGLAWHFYK